MIQVFFQINLVVELIQSLACVAVVIDAVEVIHERHQYGQNGIYSFSILRTYRKWMMMAWMAPFLNVLFNYPRYIFLVSIQAVAVVLVISPAFYKSIFAPSSNNSFDTSAIPS